MPRGSFNGLYTFEEVAKIYHMSHSNMRKMVQANKFIEGKEIKKFGKTWIITEEAIRNHFGNNIDIYFHNIKLAEIKAAREQKIQNKINNGGYKTKNRKNKTKDLSDGVDDLGEMASYKYVEVDEKQVLSSFSFE